MSTNVSAVLALRPAMLHLSQSLVKQIKPQRSPESRGHILSARTYSLQRNHHRFFTTSRSSAAASSSSKSSAAITEKSRILEKPARFNPPSHGSRRVRPRSYPGPRPSEEDIEQQRTKRYPNMMPPEGSFMYRFLTNRSLHLWITLSTLTSLAVFAWFLSFLQTTHYRSSLPSPSELLSHPIQSVRRFVSVYKLHVMQQSEEVAQKRRRKLEDVEKRKEFLREHGVEPGFLTGSWMERFGTVEGDEARERMAKEEKERQQLNGLVGVDEVKSAGREDKAGPMRAAPEASTVPTMAMHGTQPRELLEGAVDEPPRQEKKKLKMWFGIW